MSRNLSDVFVEGALRGWTIGTTILIPNIIMAFALISMLRITGLLDLMARVSEPLMGLFGLPGQAIAVLIASWLSMAGGVGVALSLSSQGLLNAQHVTILLPAIFLMGAQLQYVGRILGVAGIPPRLYPVFLTIPLINASVAMLIMRLLT